MKRCSKCKKGKPLTEFYNEARNKDGKRSECKVCQYIKIKEWNDKNKEWRKIRDAEYQRQNYYKGKRREYNRKWNQDNKDYVKKRNKEYRMKNKEAFVLRTAKYRARKLELEATLTNEQWQSIKLLFRNKCIYCGKRTKSLEREHVVPVSSSGAFILQNIVPACRSCNAHKGNRLPDIPIKLVLL